jgi:hypothetical protein
MGNGGCVEIIVKGFTMNKGGGPARTIICERPTCVDEKEVGFVVNTSIGGDMSTRVRVVRI